MVMRVSLKEYIDRRLADQDQARVIAKENVDRRLADMNDLRRQIESERGDYLTVDSYQQQHVALEAQVAAGDEKIGVRILAVERWQSKIVGGLAIAAIVVPTVTGVVASLVVYFLTRGVH